MQKRCAICDEIVDIQGFSNVCGDCEGEINNRVKNHYLNETSSLKQKRLRARGLAMFAGNNLANQKIAQ